MGAIKEAFPVNKGGADSVGKRRPLEAQVKLEMMSGGMHMAIKGVADRFASVVAGPGGCGQACAGGRDGGHFRGRGSGECAVTGDDRHLVGARRHANRVWSRCLQQVRQAGHAAAGAAALLYKLALPPAASSHPPLHPPSRPQWAHQLQGTHPWRQQQGRGPAAAAAAGGRARLAAAHGTHV